MGAELGRAGLRVRRVRRQRVRPHLPGHHRRGRQGLSRQGPSRHVAARAGQSTHGDCRLHARGAALPLYTRAHAPKASRQPVRRPSGRAARVNRVWLNGAWCGFIPVCASSGWSGVRAAVARGDARAHEWRAAHGIASHGHTRPTLPVDTPVSTRDTETGERTGRRRYSRRRHHMHGSHAKPH